MSYTIVWNENKTEGIILSGEGANRDAKMATTGEHDVMYSALAGAFYEIYGQDGECVIQQLTEIK